LETKSGAEYKNDIKILLGMDGDCENKWKLAIALPLASRNLTESFSASLLTDPPFKTDCRTAGKCQ
jgi:hypothetical protein